MNTIKLIHVGLGRWGFDWAQHIYPGSNDVEPVAYVDKEPEALGRAQAKLGASLWTARGDRPLVNAQDRMSIRRLNSEPEDLDLEPVLKYDRLGVLNAFGVAIRSGIPPSFFPSGRDNIATLSIVEAAIRSSLLGGASVKIETIL